MTLWDVLTNFSSILFSVFNTKTNFCSYILSDSSIITLTTVYYKVQYIFDFAYELTTILHAALFCSISSVTLNALVIALKFLILIALLIFIRGGIPRYRFDHLTKVGWIKYLSLVLASMLIQFLLLWMC